MSNVILKEIERTAPILYIDMDSAFTKRSLTTEVVDLFCYLLSYYDIVLVFTENDYDYRTI